MTYRAKNRSAKLFGWTAFLCTVAMTALAGGGPTADQLGAIAEWKVYTVLGAVAVLSMAGTLWMAMLIMKGKERDMDRMLASAKLTADSLAVHDSKIEKVGAVMHHNARALALMAKALHASPCLIAKMRDGMDPHVKRDIDEILRESERILDPELGT